MDLVHCSHPRIAHMRLAQPTSSYNTGCAPAVAALAASYGTPIITYEAGPSIVEGSVLEGSTPTPGYAAKLVALQRDPRFKAVYARCGAPRSRATLLMHTPP